jgi:hypothetical protein
MSVSESFDAPGGDDEVRPRESRGKGVYNYEKGKEEEGVARLSRKKREG